MGNSGAVLRTTNDGWTVSAAPAAAAPGDPVLSEILAHRKIQVVASARAQRTVMRSAGGGQLEVAAPDLPPSSVLAVVFPSGAVTFHRSDQAAETMRGSGRRNAPRGVRFRVPMPELPAEAVTRGLEDAIAERAQQTAVELLVLKPLEPLADRKLEELARRWETASWKKHGLTEGWKHVTRAGLRRKALAPAKDRDWAAPPHRNLVLVHGFFSHTHGAFKGLADTRGASGDDFFDAVKPVYGDRVFGFDHFTVSRSPIDNAIDLVAGIPDRPLLIDVITHSRGGLVARSAMEKRDKLPHHRDVNIGRCVFVAAPHHGTQLADPDRLETLLTWLSNLASMIGFGDSFAGDFVANALSWLAQRAMGAIPGVSTLRYRGDFVEDLNLKTSDLLERYSALVANFHPSSGIAMRLLDMGVDTYFGVANDLVVPSAPGWRPGQFHGQPVAPDRIGCFGPGGNLAGTGRVHHNNLFHEPETIDFLTRSLLGKPLGLSPQRIDAALPSRRLFRGDGAGAATPALPAPEVPGPRGPEERRAPAAPAAAPVPAPIEPFHLFMFAAEGAANRWQVLATYRNAHVLKTLNLTRSAFKRELDAVKKREKELRAYIDGEGEAPDLLERKALLDFGAKLFDLLLPGKVRRLYDVARAEQNGRKLSLILTSREGLHAEVPWEFAYDPNRKTFLALEDVNFLRSAFSAVPTDRVPRKSGQLRILVLVAQPLGTRPLSSKQEADLIRRGFQPLIASGLVDITVKHAATAGLLHRILESERYDVLHFIGHGAFEEESKTGTLLFEDHHQSRAAVRSDELRCILGGKGISLVFLNACETGRGQGTDFNRGVAPALIAAGIPAVVANQYRVVDPTAAAFAQHFYWALASGQAIGDAARGARIAVNYNIHGETIEWAVPVVYARAPGLTLCDGTAAPSDPTFALPTRTARSALREWVTRVGVWDINHDVPDLAEILAKLNGAQTEYFFEVADVSVPLGTWRRHPDEDDEDEFHVRIDADRLVEQLAGTPGQLGVDWLFCVTSFTLDFDWEDGYLYQTGDDDDAAIGIFSTKDLLDDLREQKMLARAITNCAVSMLSDLESHQGLVSKGRKRRNCPNFENARAVLDYIGGPLRFCAHCRSRLQSDKAHLRALDALLALEWD